MARYEHLVAFALEHPWAVMRSMMPVIAGVIAKHLAGEESDPQAIQAALVARSNRMPTRSGQSRAGGAIVVIPIAGVLAPRMNLLSDTSGGTTFETLTSQLHAAVDDPRVTTIVFDVDSPGGNVAGATEFAREVREAATQKRIIAHAQHLMASASYWPMSGATQIIASPSALVGSIGVYSLHDDISESLSKLGIKREIFTSGRYKGEGADGGPLSVEAKAHIQALVDTAGGRFRSDVAKGRGVSVPTVKDRFGEGRTFDAESALRAGLVDRIATFTEILGELAGSPAPVALDDHRRALAAASLASYRHQLDALTIRRMQ